MYALLLSSVSNHNEPTGSVVAGAASCLNTSGFEATVLCNVVTDPVKPPVPSVPSTFTSSVSRSEAAA